MLRFVLRALHTGRSRGGITMIVWGEGGRKAPAENC